MPSKPYGSICALSKGCALIEPRWTLLILNQIWNGYTHFSDIRRAVGNISPGVLSKRLEELKDAGLIERIDFPQVTEVCDDMHPEAEPARHFGFG